MKHLDLFSGIGGFAIAVEAVWPDAEHIFCDNDKFCQKVLAKYWPQAKIYGDIRQLTADTEGGQSREQTKQERGQDIGRGSSKSIDLITGGFPCQPFSQAGKRRGTEDDRFLWPEMLRVIKEFKPRWVIGENVAGFTTMVQYQSSPEVDAQGNAIGEIGNTHHRMGRFVANEAVEALEAAGYTVETFIIPACAVNAPHRRDRVWIVANRNSGGLRRYERESVEEGTTSRSSGQCDAQNPISERSGGGMEDSGQVLGSESPEAENAGPSWEDNWLEVATKFCGVDDGLPVELDGFKLTKAGHRVQRLKSLGNAIVPQVAIQILKAIKEVDKI